MTPDREPPAPLQWDLRDPRVLLATGFGVGLLPAAPGTWGSLAALPAAWLIVAWAGPWGLAAAALAAFAVGLWAAEGCSRRHGGDPGPVVIDEICGQWLVLLAAAPDALHYGLGFVLFRAFDIVKPWPVGWADRTLKGGFGIMADDVLAAGYGALALLAARHWGGV